MTDLPEMTPEEIESQRIDVLRRGRDSALAAKTEWADMYDRLNRIRLTPLPDIEEWHEPRCIPVLPFTEEELTAALDHLALFAAAAAHIYGIKADLLRYNVMFAHASAKQSDLSNA